MNLSASPLRPFLPTFFEIALWATFFNFFFICGEKHKNQPFMLAQVLNMQLDSHIYCIEYSQFVTKLIWQETFGSQNKALICIYTPVTLHTFKIHSYYCTMNPSICTLMIKLHWKVITPFIFLLSLS
jgi:hypothetical protein